MLMKINSSTIKFITENCFPCSYWPSFPEAATFDSSHVGFQSIPAILCTLSSLNVAIYFRNGSITAHIFINHF